MFINISCFMFSQVQQALQVTGTRDSEAGYPSSRGTHGRTWEASCGYAERTNYTFWQFGWASLFHPATKHCWGGKAQGETATSGHLPGSTTTSSTFCHCTGTTRLSTLHFTMCSFLQYLDPQRWRLHLEPHGWCSTTSHYLQLCHHQLRRRHPVKLFRTPLNNIGRKNRRGAGWHCHKKICKEDRRDPLQKVQEREKATITSSVLWQLVLRRVWDSVVRRMEGCAGETRLREKKPGNDKPPAS